MWRLKCHTENLILEESIRIQFHIISSNAWKISTLYTLLPNIHPPVALLTSSLQFDHRRDGTTPRPASCPPHWAVPRRWPWANSFVGGSWWTLNNYSLGHQNDKGELRNTAIVDSLIQKSCSKSHWLSVWDDLGRFYHMILLLKMQSWHVVLPHTVVQLGAVFFPSWNGQDSVDNGTSILRSVPESMRHANYATRTRDCNNY